MAEDSELNDLLYELNQAIEHYGRGHTPDPEHVEVINRLPAEHPELVRMTDDLGEYPLHKAAYYNCKFAIIRLLEAGAEVDAVSADRDRKTPLHLAAEQGGVFACEDLVAAGADPTRRAANGFTPLVSAIYRGRDAAVGALLRLGAPMDLRAAVSLRQPAVVRLTLRDNPALVRAEPDATDLVAEAAFFGGVEVIRLLLEAGADPNTAGVSQHSLYNAVARNDRAAAELLLEYGADPNREVRGVTPRQYAEECVKMGMSGLEWAVDLFSRNPGAGGDDPGR